MNRHRLKQQKGNSKIGHNKNGKNYSKNNNSNENVNVNKNNNATTARTTTTGRATVK